MYFDCFVGLFIFPKDSKHAGIVQKFFWDLRFSDTFLVLWVISSEPQLV